MVKSTTADTARGPNRDSNIAEIYSVLSALLVAGSIIDPPTDDSLDDSLRVNIPAAGTETPLVANTELTLLVNPSRGAGPVEKTIYDTQACRLGRAVLTVSLGETDLYLTPSSVLNSSENTITYIGLLIALGLYDKPNAQDAIAYLPEDALILGGEGLHVVDLTQRSTETDTPLSGLVEMLQEIARRQSGLSAYGFFSNRLKNSTPEGEPLENQDALRGTIDLTPGSNRKAEFSTYFAGAQTKENQNLPIVDHHAALLKDTQAVIDVAFTPVDRCRVSSLTIAMPDAINFNGFLGTLLAKSYQDGECIEADMRELSITENPSPVITCSFGSERLDRTVIGTSLASIASQLARIGYGEDSSDDSKASKAAIATLENLELLMRALIISTQEETDATSVKP